VKREILQQLQAAREQKNPAALVTVLEDGTQGLVYSDREVLPDITLDAAALQDIRDMMRGGRNGMLEEDRLFVRSYVPDYRLIIVGAVHIAQSLASLAQECGYQVTVIDPRRAFATEGRFQQVDLRVEWPDEAVADLAPDAQTALVTLAHDPKIDDPALIAALNSDAFYISALGSRRTHQKRVERLTEQGLGDKLERINAPAGLKLGGRSHAEIAVAILAQLIQARYGG
jgi:xanthine dehydrogenase accessory factor